MITSPDLDVDPEPYAEIRLICDDCDYRYPEHRLREAQLALAQWAQQVPVGDGGPFRPVADYLMRSPAPSIRELLESVGLEVEDDVQHGGLRIVGFCGDMHADARCVLDVLAPYAAYGARLVWDVCRPWQSEGEAEIWMVEDGQLETDCA